MIGGHTVGGDSGGWSKWWVVIRWVAIVVGGHTVGGDSGGWSKWWVVTGHCSRWPLGLVLIDFSTS